MVRDPCPLWHYRKPGTRPARVLSFVVLGADGEQDRVIEGWIADAWNKVSFTVDRERARSAATDVCRAEFRRLQALHPDRAARLEIE